MRVLNATSIVLLVIGGINWGLVGVFDYNLVDELFGEGSGLARVIYTVVGLAAVWTIVAWITKASTDKDSDTSSA